jgi:hypothetical protein
MFYMSVVPVMRPVHFWKVLGCKCRLRLSSAGYMGAAASMPPWPLGSGSGMKVSTGLLMSGTLSSDIGEIY